MVSAMVAILAAGVAAQSADDARALLQRVADIALGRSWRIEGSVITENKTESATVSTAQPFKLYMQGQKMRYEIGGSADVIIFRDGATLWEYTPSTNRYTRRDDMAGRYITGVHGWDILASAMKPTAAVAGRDQAEYGGHVLECTLVRAELRGMTRTLCIDPSRALILRDVTESKLAGQAAQSIRTIAYDRIERNIPLAASLFDLPTGAVQQPAFAPAPVGLTPPKLISRTASTVVAQVTPSKRQGTVQLSLLVGSDGVPQNVTVVRGLDIGLDERAVETVRSWRFTPGERDGVPVPVTAKVELTFHLN